MDARDEPKMDPRDEPLAPKTLALLLHAEHARHPSCGTAPLPAFPAELRPRIWSQLLELHGVRALPPPRAARGTEQLEKAEEMVARAFGDERTGLWCGHDRTVRTPGAAAPAARLRLPCAGSRLRFLRSASSLRL